MKYLSEKLSREAFLRLRQTKIGGKTGIERTSALMSFFAFDALLKRTSIIPPIDLDPEVGTAKTNREILTREFSRLAQLKSGVEPYYVLNLGEVTIGGKSAEKRFSSNFLTASLKKATTSATSYDYPSRPANPLLVLGLKATGLEWGIDRHPDWRENLPVFLLGRKTKTPFHDLACFVLRQRGFISSGTTLQEGLVDGLAEIFTQDVCAFWKTQLSFEKIYVEKVQEPFQETMPNPFGDCSWMGDAGPDNIGGSLTTRISYLENLLQIHHIPFEK